MTTGEKVNTTAQCFQAKSARGYPFPDFLARRREIAPFIAAGKGGVFMVLLLQLH